MNDRVKFDLSLSIVEPLFTALHNIKATDHSRLEMKAIAMLRTSLYFELERLMLEEHPEESEQVKTSFLNTFHRERKKRADRIKEMELRQQERAK
jgi:hypothetical protein